ncbi:MAG TPA: site-2 protease family protein [Armatimonadota bacterium]|nr:site-2 protease family protein [Armatimonadota bacterium]
MTRAFRIGRVFGIDIEIDYTWFIIFFIVVIGLSTNWLAKYLPDVSVGLRWLIAALTTILFFASVLLHELSHSVVALRSGIKISGITLFLFGGMSKMTDEPKSPGVEFRMAIAGPLMSLVLAVVFFAAAFLLRSGPGGVVFSTVFRWLGIVNGMLAAFNLLPGFPLDGGRVLRAGLWYWKASLGDATRIASSFGQGIGLMMIVGGIFMFFTAGRFDFLWLAFIGWFLMQAAQQSYRQLVLRQALSGVPVSSVMTQDLDVVPADITLDQVVQDFIMARNHPAFPVQDGDELLGLLCLNDIRSVPREQWHSMTARQATPPLSEQNTIAPSSDAWDALIRMSSEDCGRLVVIEDGRLRGIVSRTDIMRLMHHRLELGI